jgi:hypothetical protein
MRADQMEDNMTYNNKTAVDKQAMFTEITNQMAQVYAAKNHDYGNSFGESMEEFGFVAAAVRMNDKMKRIKSFAKLCPEAMKVKDESVQDTLLDLANYAVMALVELRSKT